MDQPPQKHNGEKPAPAPQRLHQSDADEDDENVKQLDECSALYLLMQNCIVESNRNWKECQKGMYYSLYLFCVISNVFSFLLENQCTRPHLTKETVFRI
ncbi:unnamed protein product [Lupinus luteus]|uniref:Uncharacterized protein n=1 Tax=Lupinus luteus TaxID=3873 RepID=A0AAV1VWH3_LUPLU